MNKTIIILVLLLLLPSLSSGDAINTTLNAVPPGEWLELPTSVLSTSGECATGVPGSSFTNCEGVITSWSGGVFSEAANTLFIYGGGHNDYGGVEVYGFNLDTSTWDRSLDSYGYPTYTDESTVMSLMTAGFGSYNHFTDYTTPANWTETSEGSNVWYFDITGYSVGMVGRTETALTAYANVIALYPVTSIAKVTSKFEYFIDTGADRLYLYAAGDDPPTVYSWVASPSDAMVAQLYYNSSNQLRTRYFDDGNTPISVHTYRSLAYDPVNDTMWRLGPHSMYGNAGQGDTHNAYGLSLSTMTWARYGDIDIPTGGGQLTAYHNGSVYVYGTPTEAIGTAPFLCTDVATDNPDNGNSCEFLAVFDTTAHTSQRIDLTTYLSCGQYAYMFVYVDPVSEHRLLMFLWWGTGSPEKNLYYYDLDEGTSSLTLVGLTNVSGNTDSLEWGASGVPVGMYDPTTSGTGYAGPVVWRDGIDIYKGIINKAAGEVTWYKFTGTNPGEIPDAEAGLVPNSTGTYGRFNYSDRYNAFIVLNEYDESVYAYRLPSTVADSNGTSAMLTTDPVIEPTIYGASIYWALDPAGSYLDVDHDATATVKFREVGSAVWTTWMNLRRIDYNDVGNSTHFNEVSGSIWDLTPGTDYDVQISYNDPDGGTWTRTQVISTYPLPATDGRDPLIVSASGSGTACSEESPCTLSQAQTNAIAGDVIKLKAGSYGAFTFNKSGSAGQYIKYEAYGNGSATFYSETSDTPIYITGSYVWVHNLTASRLQNYSASQSRVLYIGGTHVAVTNCTLTSTGTEIVPSMGIGGSTGMNHAYIAYNTIVGINDPSAKNIAGEGIDLQKSIVGGNTIAYNSISYVGDGISYPGGNCDIFGNDIFLVSDDGVEADFAGRNVRIYRNRITSAYNTGISFQDPGNGMPWYVFKNQIIGWNENAIKFPSHDDIYTGHNIEYSVNYVIANNTFVNWDHMTTEYNSLGWPNGLMKNNLFIDFDNTNPVAYWMIHFNNDAVKDWRTDWTANLFDPGPNTTGNFYNYDIDGTDLKTAAIADFEDDFNASSPVTVTMTGNLEGDKSDIFSNYAGTMTDEIANAQPARKTLQLKSDSIAIDQGVVLVGITDGYLGDAPDIGAYEYGQSTPVYGPDLTLTSVNIGTWSGSITIGN